MAKIAHKAIPYSLFKNPKPPLAVPSKSIHTPNSKSQQGLSISKNKTLKILIKMLLKCRIAFIGNSRILSFYPLLALGHLDFESANNMYFLALISTQAYKYHSIFHRLLYQAS